MSGAIHWECEQALTQLLEYSRTVQGLILESNCIYGYFSGASFDPENGEDAVRMLLDAVFDYWHESSRDGRETTHYTGVYPLEKELFKAIGNLNQYRMAFKMINLKFRKMNPNDHRHFWKTMDQGKAPARVERYIRNYGRLSINQLYRCFPVLEKRPDTIHYSWSEHSKSIRKYSVKKAINELQSLRDYYREQDNSHIDLQIKALASISSNEILAKVTEQSPFVKINCFYDFEKRPITIKSNLPLIVPMNDKPMFVDIADQPKLQSVYDQKRKTRSDQKIEQQPIAPSIHIYRYRYPETL